MVRSAININVILVIVDVKIHTRAGAIGGEDRPRDRWIGSQLAQTKEQTGHRDCN
jgi:hypothetical protein